MNYHNNWFHGT